MASIWNDIEIDWNGETYTVRPSIEFINHLERRDGSSISKMYQRVMNYDLPSGKACELIADTINWAGRRDAEHVTVKAEDVFVATSGGVDQTAIHLAMAVLTALMPAPKDDGKEAAPTGKKKSAPKRTGGKSTG